MKNSDIIEALDKILEEEDDIKIQKAIEKIGCSNTQLFEAIYTAQKRYTIIKALTPIATISKNKVN